MNIKRIQIKQLLRVSFFLSQEAPCVTRETGIFMEDNSFDNCSQTSLQFDLKDQYLWESHILVNDNETFEKQKLKIGNAFPALTSHLV